LNSGFYSKNKTDSGLTLTVHTYLYAISTLLTGYDVLKVKRVILDNNELYPMSEDDMIQKISNERDWRDYDNADSGTPELWYITDDNQIGFHEPPDADNVTNLDIDIAHLPTASMSLATSTPELHTIFHDDIVLYMVYKAYCLEDDESRANRILGILRESLKVNIVNYTKRFAKYSIDQHPRFVHFNDS